MPDGDRDQFRGPYRGRRQVPIRRAEPAALDPDTAAFRHSRQPGRRDRRRQPRHLVRPRDPGRRRILDLIQHKLGLVNGDALDWLELEIIGRRTDNVTFRDRKPAERTSTQGRIVGTCHLRGRGRRSPVPGRPLRAESFRQRRPDGRGGWIWRLDGIETVPYRLPTFAGGYGGTIHIVEGEKDVEALRRLGFLATCNPMGAGKWPDHFARYFRDYDVVILPDNDDVGRDHAAKVARNLAPVAERVRIVELPDLPEKGDVSDWIAGGGKPLQLIELIKTAPIYEPPEPEPAAEANCPAHHKERPAPAITATPFTWTDPAALPRRQWLYGRHLIRGFVSTTIGIGGRGKTSLMIADALAMVTGRALLGDQPAGPLKVWLISMEDPIEELNRRIAAACLRYGISEDDLGDRIFIDAGLSASVVIATEQRDGIKIMEPMVDALCAEITTRKIDVLMVDPFVDTHAVAENDNAKIAAVMRIWAGIAERTGCAIDLAHHVRKPSSPDQALTADDARGASTQVYKARHARVLNTMTKKEAEIAKIDNPRLYFGVTSGKANLTPPADKVTWRRTVGVSLGNGVAPHDPGDEIGVVEPWKWPDTFASVSVQDAQEVQRRIAAGEWRSNPRAENWAGKVVAEVLDLDLDEEGVRASVKRMLAEWCSTDALRVVKRPDENRMKRDFIEAGQWIT